MIVLRGLKLNYLFLRSGCNTKMFCTGGVHFEIKNKCGVITMKKPKVLNALNTNMIQSIFNQLEAWENTMSMVIIRGEGRAFSVGGDIKYATGGGPENTMAGKMFFKSAYKLDHKVATYKLPYIALIDGISMGGALGVSVHGMYRVVTEKTIFAMPEVAIGLFPDAGASYFLSRIPDNLGMFLALTGYRLVGAECLKIGFGTHYCKSSDIPKLFRSLLDSNGKVMAIEDALQKFSEDICNVPFTLAPHRKYISSIFALNNMEDIFQALQNYENSWSKKVLNDMKKMSPTALKITHRELILGKSMDLKSCLKMEYRLAVAALETRISKDLYEGVRALLIEKDKNPKWYPEKIEDICESMIMKCFAPLITEEELAI